MIVVNSPGFVIELVGLVQSRVTVVNLQMEYGGPVTGIASDCFISGPQKLPLAQRYISDLETTKSGLLNILDKPEAR